MEEPRRARRRLHVPLQRARVAPQRAEFARPAQWSRGIIAQLRARRRCRLVPSRPRRHRPPHHKVDHRRVGRRLSRLRRRRQRAPEGLHSRAVVAAPRPVHGADVERPGGAPQSTRSRSRRRRPPRP